MARKSVETVGDGGKYAEGRYSEYSEHHPPPIQTEYSEYSDWYSDTKYSDNRIEPVASQRSPITTADDTDLHGLHQLVEFLLDSHHSNCVGGQLA